MQVFKYGLSVLLLVVVALADANVNPPTELKIDVTHLPSDCPAKAQTGDKIKVHYVSSSYLCEMNSLSHLM
jgi:FK506-binding protein 2